MFLLKLKYALRAVARYKAFTYAHLIGLAVAILAAVSIYAFVQSEVSTDSQFTDRDQLYRIVREVAEPNAAYETPTLAGPFKELIRSQTGLPATDIVRVYRDDELVTWEDRSFFEKNVLYVDASFFQVLDFPLAMGDPAEVLTPPNAAVISPRIAQKYFGDQNPLGQTLDLEGKGTLEVTGVLATPTPKSHLALDILVNTQAMGYASRFLTDMETHAFSYYLKVPAGEEDLMQYTLQALSESHMQTQGAPQATLSLQPLAHIYFDEPMLFDLAEHNQWALIQTLVVIGIILLLVVSVNLVNLTIARLSRGVKQIGVKKILGSTKGTLIIEWALEVYVMTWLATVLALGALFLFSPLLQEIYPIPLPSSGYLLVGAFLLPLALTVLIVTVPALIFSTLNSFSALSGKLGALKTNRLQHSLLGFQFAVSFVLIVLTLVIFQQFEYLQNKDLGLDEERVLVFNSNNKHSWQNRTFIKEEVKRLSGVQEVSMVYGGLPDSPTEAYSYQVDDFTYQWNTAFVEPNILEVLNLKLLDGAPFDERLISQQATGVVLNEQAARTLGWPQEPVVGKQLTFEEEGTVKQIVGVVQDYHYASFKSEIEPLVLQATGWEETFVVKLSGQDYATVLPQVEAIWQTYVPKYPFSYYFLDDSFQKMHLEDTQQRKFIYWFTLLTILMATMSTLSLGALVQQAKVKEITIRKILGAPLGGIFYLLSARFVRTFLLASLLGAPLAWYLATQWLTDFSYRIALSPLFFVLGFALLITFVMALIVVQSWKTATLNPAYRLREE
ncbi:MAG: ABC transporter permease [Bacteroidota bacterium]